MFENTRVCAWERIGVGWCSKCCECECSWRPSLSQDSLMLWNHHLWWQESVNEKTQKCVIHTWTWTFCIIFCYCFSTQLSYFSVHIPLFRVNGQYDFFRHHDSTMLCLSLSDHAVSGSHLYKSDSSWLSKQRVLKDREERTYHSL